MTHLNSPSEAQICARAAFDLDAAMEALPPSRPSTPLTGQRGQAGVRLRETLVADISDDLLREVARTTFGAQRCSERYLDALRIVLGNQADSERHGYMLEMNQRVTFATPKVMRQIIGQMETAGISFGSVVVLGEGRCQTVQCYRRSPGVLTDATTREVAAEVLERMYRTTEATDDRRRATDDREGAHTARPLSTDMPAMADSIWTFVDSEVPF